MKKIIKGLRASLLLSGLLLASTAWSTSLETVISGKHRELSSVRDQYRHPLETLTFFGLKESMTVVEIWPGAKGWYTEILGPYLKDKGKLYAAQFNADSSSDYYKSSRADFIKKLEASPELYSGVEVTTFNPPDYIDIAPEASADLVLTFRNVHNWYMRGGGTERVLSAFQAFHRALKPGGHLGVVEHRLPKNRSLADQEASGYMREDYVIEIAQKAGFELIDGSEINQNDKDNADHPKGVWTLPPSLRLGEENQQHYLSIGESDRMTLLFRKKR